MEIDLPTLINVFRVELLAKGIFLVFIFLYCIFTIILLSQVISLNKIMYIHPLFASRLLVLFAALYVGITLSLFIAVLVIL